MKEKYDTQISELEDEKDTLEEDRDQLDEKYKSLKEQKQAAPPGGGSEGGVSQATIVMEVSCVHNELKLSLCFTIKHPHTSNIVQKQLVH